MASSSNAEAIAHYLLELADGGARLATVQRRRRTLRHLSDWSGRSLLDLVDVELCRWSDETTSTRSAPSAAADITDARGFYRWAADAGLVTVPTAFLRKPPRAPRYAIGEEWAAALAAWRPVLVEAGRTNKTVTAWLNYVSRAAAVMTGGPAEVSPSELLEGLEGLDFAPASLMVARTAVRAFYIFNGTGRTDLLMTPALPRLALGAWAPAIEDWSTFERVRGYSPQTIVLHRHHLRRASEQLQTGPWDVRLDDLLKLLDVPAWSAETRRTWRGSLRSFYRWAVDTGRTVDDPTRKLPSARVPQGKPRPVPDAVVDRALMAAQGADRLMLVLALYAGLRRAEISKVNSADVVEGVLRVVGKGDRTRMIPLHPTLELALAGVDGFAFPGRFDGHVSADVVGKRLSRLLGPGWTGHTLRHRFASKTYAVDRDLFAVQTLLGHSKPETTARYTAIPNGALRAAVLGAEVGLVRLIC